MRITFLMVGLLLGNSLAEDAALTLTKSGYSLSVAGDGHVLRWTAPVFRIRGLRDGDRVVWARTLLSDSGDGETSLLDDTHSYRPGTFAVTIWENPGQRIRVTALVFRAGTAMPKSGHLKKCDVRLDLEVRVADGQSATARSGDIVARLRKDAKRQCVHDVDLENTGNAAVVCELEIVPRDGRRVALAKTTVTVPAGAKAVVQLDGKLPVHALYHDCRIVIRVHGRKDRLVLHTRPWLAPHSHVRDDPIPPPPPAPDR